MISQAVLVKLTVLCTMILSTTLTNSACPRTSCGNLTVHFPFGTSSDCSLDESFLITCSNHSYDPPKPYLNQGNMIEILDISLNGLMKISSPVAIDCYDESGSQINSTISDLNLSKFSISSTRNKFTAVGCDTYGLIQGSEWKQMSGGCVSWCDSINSLVNGTCSGIGCCQTSIPKGVKDFSVGIRSYRNHTRVRNFNPCSYAFVVETEAFEFTSLDLIDLQNRKTVPVVLDWSVGNSTCEQARKNLSTYACRAIHSECSDSRNGIGYNCNCLKGFQGNPYIVDGCIDIDECSSTKPCQGTCTNLLGSYSCSCPDGLEGDGKNNGSGCHTKTKTNGSNIFYIVSGLMIPALGSSWIIWRRKQKKVVKLRKKLFKQNGGLVLENMLPIFTAESLKMATYNYDQNNVILRQHSGISYKGVLTDGSHVMIKTLYVPDEWDTELFVTKLSVFSQIQHTNVVRLIGCCLETQMPLLVHEFVAIKTLYDHIHDENLAISLSWDVRLKIAAEIAETLAYVHCIGSLPIIHGNLNSSSILLNGDYTVKIDDFALFSCTENCYADTVGYIDPESLLLGRLTVKSDVYSFGVVLAELLTGMEEVSCERPEGEKLLAKYFVSTFNGGDLSRILDKRLRIEDEIERLNEVAKLAERCLNHSSFERPTMNEVAMALKSVITRNSILPEIILV